MSPEENPEKAPKKGKKVAGAKRPVAPRKAGSAPAKPSPGASQPPSAPARTPPPPGQAPTPGEASTSGDEPRPGPVQPSAGTPAPAESPAGDRAPSPQAARPAPPTAQPSPPARPSQPQASGATPQGAGAAAAATPPPKQADSKPASTSGDGASRQVDVSEGRAQAPDQGALKRIAPTRAQDVIQQQIAKRTADPKKVKLPQFPAPASERPQALKDEELRREAIAEKERERREAILEGLDEEQRERLEHDWQQTDKLDYVPDPHDREIEIFEIRPPFSYVQIVKNDRTHEMFYHAIEPKLSRDEKILLAFIEDTLIDVLDLQPEDLDKTELEEYIRGKFQQVLFDYSISLGDEEASAEEARERLLYYVLRDFIGEGPLDILMHDPLIEDISCDGPHVPIFVYHRKYEALTTTIRYKDHDHLDSFVIRMAQRSGKHVSIAEPILDATMKDGSRLQATLAKEVSSFGSTFTIRKFREVPFSPIDMVRFGTMSSAMLAYLWMVIEGHMSGIYAGGTASGKTTAINALMMFIPPQNKVITIEDTRELRVPEPNWIAGITRDGFGPRDAHGRQAGEIDMFQLLKNALRQRPEFIVVGEVRGAEAYALFQAMATGHSAWGTMHADSVDAVIHRLESDPINIPRSLLEALDIVAVQIQTRVAGKRVRRTKQLTEVVGLDPHTREILTNEVFHWDPSTDAFEYSGISYGLERLAHEGGKTSKEIAAEMEDRVRLINHLVDLDERDYNKTALIIKKYYKDKPTIMAKVDAGEGWD